MKFKTTLIIILLFSFSSCKIITALKELNREKAKVYSYSLNDIEIKYIPMHHLGKKKFYDDVTNKIKKYKKNGFIVYYELISPKLDIDSIQKDLVSRKARKIIGFNGNYKELGKGTFSEEYINQPPYEKLGITKKDRRADVNLLQFVNECERINGVIHLDSIDLNTDLGEKYERKGLYTDKQLKKIVVEFRNQYLINLIKSSGDDKILIIYGEGHRKDFEKRIKN